jgi:hypothetical protein
VANKFEKMIDKVALKSIFHILVFYPLCKGFLSSMRPFYFTVIVILQVSYCRRLNIYQESDA